MSAGLSDPAAQTAAYTYTDAASGLSFTVPANWAEAPLSDERDIIDAKFLSNGEDGATIFFTVEDLFPGLAEANKRQLSRGDIGNSVFSKSEIADAHSRSENFAQALRFLSQRFLRLLHRKLP